MSLSQPLNTLPIWNSAFLRIWVVFLIAVNPVTAATDAAPTNTQNSVSEELLTINMRDADIGSVIQWIAEQTNKKIVVDPRVRAKVTILANKGMTADQAFEVFLAMLDVYGYAVTETGGILRIFPAVQAKSSPKQLIENFDELGGGEQIMYVFRAENVSANRLRDVLKPLLPSSGYIAAYPQSNSLVIADDAENVKRLVALVKKIDASGSVDIEVINLVHADAENVSGLVLSLLKNDIGQSFSIAPDSRSNSLLMSGDPATSRRVRQLVKQLDQPISDNGNTRVVYLHYLDAEEVLPILKGMGATMQENNKNSGDNSNISIEASESSNALIMTAPPSMLDVMSRVIEQIDIRRASILVEAIIVEVSKDFSQTIGVEWSTSLSADSGTEAITNFGLRNVDENGAVSLLGSGLNLGFYRNGSLRVLAQAIANENDANILSSPRIMTMDNEEAEILVGSNVPFITGQSTGSSSTTGDPFTTIERHDIGLTLKITPQINEGDSITLDILQEVETISEATTVANDIVTNKRSIKTKVIVEDDTILVLGGLVSDDVQELVSKVPFLGDLPVLGNLFRTTTDRVVKKNLMVFIHPVIVDSEQISDNVSRKNYDLMKSLQEKYNTGKFTVDDTVLPDFSEFNPQEKN
ncbi:MAG: type II secretion system secretin GspD [Oceanicoccus sp.]